MVDYSSLMNLSSLDVDILQAEQIDATKINVTELKALGATFGSMYSNTGIINNISGVTLNYNSLFGNTASFNNLTTTDFKVTGGITCNSLHVNTGITCQDINVSTMPVPNSAGT